jgi:hypothetical protein
LIYLNANSALIVLILYDCGYLIMRKALSIAGMMIFVSGFVWQCGRWLLRWAGYGLGLRSLPGSYNSFVESVAAKITNEVSIAWIVGPWLLMSIGLIALIILRSRTTE